MNKLELDSSLGKFCSNSARQIFSELKFANNLTSQPKQSKARVNLARLQPCTRALQHIPTYKACACANKFSFFVYCLQIHVHNNIGVNQFLILESALTAKNTRSISSRHLQIVTIISVKDFIHLSLE